MSSGQLNAEPLHENKTARFRGVQPLPELVQVITMYVNALMPI
jgi:hypothetical protein